MNTVALHDADGIIALLQLVREHLDRIEAMLRPKSNGASDNLDPKNPLNKSGLNLTARGVEVCYRLFDKGMTRYAVKKAMDISYGAATHRHHAWEKHGGKNRERQPLE
jgi:hypothetical protein